MTKTKKKTIRMGRPKVEIDWQKFEFACKLLATKEEICGLLEVSDATLQRNIKEKYDDTFEGVLKKYSGEAKISLRRWQMKKAQDGSVPILIWLGKQHLGQRDKNEISGIDGGTIDIKLDFANDTNKNKTDPIPETERGDI